MDDVIKEIFNHMEFLGYRIEDVEDQENRWVANSENSPKFLIRSLRGGIHFMAGFPNHDTNITPEEANEINKDSWFIKTVAVDEESFVLETVMPKVYEKISFGQFLDSINTEIKETLGNIVELKEQRNKKEE